MNEDSLYGCSFLFSHLSGRGLIDLYISKLESSPLLTKAITSGCITALSNYISQKLDRLYSIHSSSIHRQTRTRQGKEKKSKHHDDEHDTTLEFLKWNIDWKNVMKFFLFGLLWAGPSTHYWQNALEKIVPRRLRETKGSWAVRKTIVDQMVYGPIANAVFLCFMGSVVEQKSLRATLQKLRRDFLRTQVNGWLVWPLASALNQLYVPLQLRVLWLNIVSLAWSTWLMLHKSPRDSKKKSS